MSRRVRRLAVISVSDAIVLHARRKSKRLVAYRHRSVGDAAPTEWQLLDEVALVATLGVGMSPESYRGALRMLREHDPQMQLPVIVTADVGEVEWKIAGELYQVRRP
jgi:hypothetical protein